MNITSSTRDQQDIPYDKLCALEFDEQGDRWAPEQLRAARNMIRTTPEKPLLIVFIHGWHNNAHPGNANLRSFNTFLKELAKAVNDSDTRVEGVYIGWRGLAVERQWDKTGIGWLLRNTTFYSRKSDTDLVAGIPLTQSLYELAQAARGRGGRVIFIGHSFGGRILEKAMAQAILGQTLGDPSKSAILPADLTLLINPASEAITARRLKLALARWSQPTPAIISVTSSGDTDTGSLWPMALKTATLTKSRSFRRYDDKTDQREYVVSTAGHSTILLDRDVVRLEPQPPPPPGDPAKWDFQYAKRNMFRSADTWWAIRELPNPKKGFIMNEEQASGYWVIKVPKEIIPDHNDIFKPSAIELFLSLYRICKHSIDTAPSLKAVTVPPTESQDTMTQADIVRR